MVVGFIQQEQLGLAHNQFGEEDELFLAATQHGRLAPPMDFFQPHLL